MTSIRDHLPGVGHRRAADSAASGRGGRPVANRAPHGERTVATAAVMRLWPVPESVRSARRVVAHACREAAVTDDDCHVAVLLTSEVVTDAVLHTHGIITCAVDGGAGSISVAVSHPEPTPPAQRGDGTLPEGGPGRRLLAALAGAWGDRTRDDAQTVWFRVP